MHVNNKHVEIFVRKYFRLVRPIQVKYNRVESFPDNTESKSKKFYFRTKYSGNLQFDFSKCFYLL